MQEIIEFLSSLKEILEYEFIQTERVHISLINIITLLMIMAIARISFYLISQLIKRARVNNEVIDKGKAYTMSQLVKYLIYSMATIFAIESLGINVSILIASSAALFVGIGLGLQNIFNDIVSGIFLLFEQSVAVGDVVEIDSLVGQVKEINIRTSRIKTRDGIMIIVPNSKLIGNNVINWSTENKRTRFVIKVGVMYGSDTRLVEKLLIECALNHPDVDNTPKPLVRFSSFGDSSLDFELLFWTEEAWHVEIIKSDIRFAIDDAFRKNNVTIPFPQRDLHIKSGFKD
jgi:small-conductance mechanosensitive channel